MSEVTHDQANLMLRIYELRREPRLREARQWFVSKFVATNMEELAKKYPAGSEENASFRMVTSYWEMACGLLNRGLMDDELFFENNTEFWIVWQRLKNLAPLARTAYNNPRLYRNIESAVGRIEAYWQRTMPGYLETQTKRIAAMFEQFSKAAHKPS
ncbi:MAG TPA: hypothetical protein VFO34_06675 [Candidatus Acidoferrales bacterium]|nr:hypothetical protein [Candidatus Acidoferrales bacterium]